MERIWIFLYVAACTLTGVAGILAVLPQNCVVMKGQQATMECETDGSERRLRWERDLPAFDKEAEKIVFNGYDISPYVAPFCKIFSDYAGKYDIQINASTAEAAQRYKCLEPRTLENGTAELIVLDSDPLCTDHSNSDYINATCIIHFSGNWPPQMHWTLDGEDVHEKYITQELHHNKSLKSSLVLQRNSTFYSISCKTDFTGRLPPSATTAKNVPTYSNVWQSLAPASSLTTDDRKVKIIAAAISCTLAFLLFVIGIFLYRHYRKRPRPGSNNTNQGLPMLRQ